LNDFLELATVSNGDFLGAFTRLRSIGFNLLDNIHAFDDLSENDVFSVQPRSFGGANEKLRPIGVGSGVGHGQNSGSGVLQLEVLILEFVSVNRLSTSSVVVGEVATLAHEVGDDTVEGGALVAETLLAGAKGTEVFGSLGDNISPQLHDNTADHVIAGSDIKKHTRATHFDFGCSRFLWI